MKRHLVILSDLNVHLGLFDDLNKINGIDIFVFPEKGTSIKKIINRVSSQLLFRINVLEQGIVHDYDDIIITDSSIANLEHNDFKIIESFSKKPIKLLLLNSINAGSPVMYSVRNKLEWFNKSDIYTYDRVEAEKYGYRWYGLNYYSKQQFDESIVPEYDCYFVGGMKGNRDRLIIDSYKYLKKNSVNARYECMPTKGTNRNLLEECGIVWLNNGRWQPYKEILRNVERTRCIIEILQEGQESQSIRYFESVCYNRKLLTNNPHIVDLPYYNDRYMKYFERLEDIDIDWLLDKELPAYNYKDSFSPVNSTIFR